MSAPLSQDALGLLQRRADEAGAPPPASADAIRESEHAFGFALPAALRQVYGLVANGGFGPGYGLLGLVGGATDEFGDTAVSRYVADRGSPDLIWPEGLVTLCSWGDEIASCVEARSEAGPVSVFDPGALAYGAEMEVLDARACLFFHRPSVAEWLLAWARGADLWRTEMFPDPDSGVPGVSRLRPWSDATLRRTGRSGPSWG